MVKAKENKNRIIVPKSQAFFEELYANYYASLINFCENILFDIHESEDIVQEVFLELWNNNKTIEIKSSIKTYLYSCVKYKAFNRIKKLNIIDRHQEQLAEAYLSAHEYDELPKEQLKQNVRDFVKTLPEQMRKVLEYHSFYGWKQQEIADEMGIGINTVKTHIKRAYKKFRSDFTKDYLPIVIIWYFINN